MDSVSGYLGSIPGPRLGLSLCDILCVNLTVT